MVHNKNNINIYSNKITKSSKIKTTIPYKYNVFGFPKSLQLFKNKVTLHLVSHHGLDKNFSSEICCMIPLSFDASCNFLQLQI